MNKVLAILFLMVSQLTFTQTKLTNNEIDLLTKRVKKTAESTKTIISDFIQYKHLDFLTNDIKTEGNLTFKTPDLIKWEYTKPYKYIAVFKNNAIHINDNGDKNSFDLGANKNFKGFNQLIINSIRGNLFDKSEFDIDYFKIKNTYVVKFVPKKESFRSMINSFILTFNKKTVDVTEIKMNESETDYTRIVFINKKINQPVADDSFHN